MSEASRTAERARDDSYQAPKLTVHGTVSELTLGQTGTVTDTAPSGSQFPDGAGG